MGKIGSKPAGIKGKLAGILMNIIHGAQYRKIINDYIVSEIDSKESINVLDIGCGGGKAIKIFTSILENSKIYGIDHASDMVNLSRKVNRKELIRGRVEIVQGGVGNIPFEDAVFTIVTAFDTINFWDDYSQAFSEIMRVLKRGGAFYVINAYPKEGTKWWDFVRFKNDTEYREALTKNGFHDIDIKFLNNTIIIKAVN